MPIVRMPDGAQVNFPDDMPEDQIRSMIGSKFPELAPKPGLIDRAKTALETPSVMAAANASELAHNRPAESPYNPLQQDLSTTGDRAITEAIKKQIPGEGAADSMAKTSQFLKGSDSPRIADQAAATILPEQAQAAATESADRINYKADQERIAAEKLRKHNLFMAATGENPDPEAVKLYREQQIADAKKQDIKTNWTDEQRGAAVAVYQVPQLLSGLEAGAGAVGEKIFGKNGLSTAIKNDGLEGNDAWSAKSQDYSKQTDSLTSSFEMAKSGNLSALVHWMRYGIGYSAVQAAEAIGTAGIGGTTAAALDVGAGRMAAGMVTKESTRILEQAAGKKLAGDELAKAASVYGTSALAKQATANVATRIGQQVGMAAQSFGMEGGEIFGDTVAEAQKEGRELTGLDLSRAFAATLVAGGLEYMGENFTLNTILGRSSIVNTMIKDVGAKGMAARGAIGGASGMVVGSSQETGQTIAEEYGKGHDPFTESGWKNIIDSAGLGALGEGMPGVVGGALNKPEDKPVFDGTHTQYVPTNPLQTAHEHAADVLVQPTVDAAIKAAEISVSNKSNDELLDKLNILAGVVPSTAPATEGMAATSPLVEKQGPPNATGTGIRGSATEIVLPDNKTIPAQWEVIDADQVQATLQQGQNQPRDRSRAASNVQVQGIANNPNYTLLRDSPVMDFGAPTLSQDGAIVGGNGRFEGISRAYDQGTHTDYRAKMEADAQSKGIDPASFAGMGKPVLVRRITQPFDTKALAVASNSGGSLQYSALEQAKIDGDRMKDIGDIEVNDTGDVVMTGDNMQNVRRALTGYTAAELGSLTDKDGQLSQEGVRRIKNALLYKAYGNSTVLSRLVESTDPELKSVMGALVRSAGSVASVRSDMQTGNKPIESDITPHLLSAVEQLASVKAKGISVEQHLAQQGLLGKDYSDESAEILSFLQANIRSQKRMAEFIKSYYDAIANEDHLTDSMFEAAPLTNKERISHAIQQTNAEETSGSAGQSGETTGKQSESATSPADSGTEGKQDSSVAEKAALQSELKDALAEVGAVMRDMAHVARIMPEDHAKLYPSLVKLFGVAFKMGYFEIKAATRFVRAELSRLSADMAKRVKFLPNSLLEQAAKEAADKQSNLDEQGLFAQSKEEPILKSYTNSEVLAREASSKKAEEEKNKEAPAKNVTADQADLFNPQGVLFNSNRDESHIQDKITHAEDKQNQGNYESPALHSFVDESILKDAHDFVEKNRPEKASEQKFHAAEVAIAEASIKPLLAKAESHLAEFTVNIRAIAEETGIGSKVGDIKKLDRCVKKLLNPDEPYAVRNLFGEVESVNAQEDLRDTLRATIVVNSYSDVEAVIKSIKKRFTLHPDPKRMKVRWNKPTAEGYRDVLMNVVYEDGLQAEIQINTPEMMAAKDGICHVLYEISREYGVDKNVKEEAVAKQQVIYGAAYAASSSDTKASNSAPVNTTANSDKPEVANTLSSDLTTKVSPEGSLNIGVPDSRDSKNLVPGGNDLGKGESSYFISGSSDLNIAKTDQNDKQNNVDGGKNGTAKSDTRGDEGKGSATAGGSAIEQQSGSVHNGPDGANIAANSLPLVTDSQAEGTGPSGYATAEAGNLKQRKASGNRDRAERSTPAGRDIPAKSGLNYHFTDSDLDYKGSWPVKAEQNIKAIELVKKLEAEKRNATREEQAVLARFIGWGAGEIRNKIFDPQIDRVRRKVGAVNDAQQWFKDNKKESMSRYDYGSPYNTVKYMLEAAGTSIPWGTEITKPMLEKLADKETTKWLEMHDKLKGLLTDEEWKTAERSTQYAHYTGKIVVNEMFRWLDRAGFKGGSIIEPGAGNGVFPGLMPEVMGANSVYTGIEYDQLTGAILKHLQPDERILVESFIDSSLPDNFYDVAIGNPPFSDAKVLSDPRYKKNNFALHNYFFAKTMDKVKPGGLLMFVTSRYTMDGNSAIREYLSDKADLLGVIRLPETAFKKNAGTEVVTDILFMRKKVDGEKFEGHEWVGTDKVSVKGGTHMINEYFAKHPEMVLGEGAIDKNGMYAENQYTVLPNKSVPIEKLLADAIDTLPREVFKPAQESSAKAAQVREIDWNPKAKKEGNYYISDDGKVMQVENRAGVPAKVAAKDVAMVKDFVGLRDAVNQAQYDQLNNGDWEASLKALHKQYKAFVKAHGLILQNTVTERVKITKDDETGEDIEDVVQSRRFTLMSKLYDDPEFTKVMALESINDDTGVITESKFLTERVLEKRAEAKIETVHDALLTSLNDIGHVDMKLVAERIGLSEKETIEALGSAVYESPSGGWQMADEYLSGNVKDKLKDAQEAAKTDRKYERNVEALTQAQPSPVPPSDITTSLGMNWIPSEVYQQFLYEKAGVTAEIKYNEHTGNWSVNPLRGDGTTQATIDWGTSNRPASSILESGLTGRPIRITKTKGSDAEKKVVFDAASTEAAVQKLKEMRAAFKEWMWQDAARTDKLVSLYNNKFNTTVSREFDGRHLTLPGSTSSISVFDHVKRGAWRIVQSGNTYLAHAVGSGKTWQMVISAMEQKRLGLINKPMIVVPNHMLQQFSQEWMQLYPAARLMVADEKQFHTDNRKRFVARAAMSDLDGVIITHSAFKLLDLDPAFKQKMIQEQLDYMEAALSEVMAEEGIDEAKKSRNPKVRDIQNRIEKLEEKLKDAMSGEGKDKAVRFDEMGVDFLYVDEAHEFRKLPFTTARQVKGIDSSGSERAFDLYMKTRWLEEKKPGRSLVMASGTPITNTLAEIYSVQRFMQPKVLEERGLQDFDSWASMFGEEHTEIEADASGKYSPVTRFSKFVNVPELTQMFREFADVLTSEHLAEMLGDKRPKLKDGYRKIVVTPETSDYKAYREALALRLKKSREWKPSKDQPNNPDPIIKIIGDGRLAAIDMRFVDPSLPSDPHTKLNTMIDGVIRSYKKYSDLEYVNKDGTVDPVKGATQMVFSDIGFGAGVAENRGFNARQWMEKKLQGAGIPKSQYAFMSDYKGSAEKQKLFKDVNAGRVRILIGSSKNMGTGVNAQQRLRSLHHLDTPWFPADLEQREGRIVRQGNKNRHVRVFAYSAKGSYDTVMWQLLARKQKFIDQALSGDSSVRELDDISESSQFAMATAMTAGDERAIRLAGLKSDIEKYERLFRAHEENRMRMREAYNLAGNTIDYSERKLPEAEKLSAKAQDLSGDNFTAKAGKTTFDKTTESARKVWGEALLGKLKEWTDSGKEGNEQIGEVSGFQVNLIAKIDRNNDGKPLGYYARIELALGENKTILSQGDFDPAGAVGLSMRATNAVANLRRVPDELRQAISDAKSKRNALESRLDSKFQFTEDLTNKRNEAASLETEMMATSANDVLVNKAKAFAEKYHGEIDQRRKFTNEPYITHPAGVVEILKTVAHTPEMLAAAWAHDTVEDTNATIDDVDKELGHEVAGLVRELTSPANDGKTTRAERAQIKRDHSSKASAQAQTIKLADIIHNVEAAATADPEFAKMYLEEKRLQIEGLTQGEPELRERAYKLLNGDGVKFSRGNKAIFNHTPDSLQSALLASHKDADYFALQAMFDAGRAKVITEDQAKSMMGEDALGSNAQAFFNPSDSTTYFIANNIARDTSVDELRGLVRHEVAVHALKLGKDSAEFKSILKQVEMMKQAGNKKVVDAFNRVPADTAPEHVTEEAIAYLSQNNPELPIIKRIIAWFRNALRAIGKGMPFMQRMKINEWANKLNEDDILYMAQTAMANEYKANTSAEGMKESERYEQKVRPPVTDYEKALAEAGMYSKAHEQFYSQLRLAIRDTPDRIFQTGKQLAMWLDSNAAKLGIKKDELYWTGIADWLNTKGKVTKADVLAYLDGNGVQVREVMLGQEPTQKEMDDLSQQEFGENFHQLVSHRQRDILDALDKGATKFAPYQLPGGENYRELLLTLPHENANTLYDKQNVMNQSLHAKYGDGWQNKATAEELNAYRELGKRAEQAENNQPFRSGHFDQPNILAHIRFNERTDSDGNKVLFIEEIQSDWGQKGKKEGFGGARSNLNDKELAEWRYLADRDANGEDLKGAELSRFKELDMRHQPDVYANRLAVPSAPFVTDTKAWTALALKRMIAYAADNGFDRVAWTTGEQQADRYSLAKQIDSLMYAKLSNGLYQIKVIKNIGDSPTMLGSFEESKLEDKVGKEVAQKIVNGEGSQVPHTPHKMLNNLDLKVGGEGMKGFYDAIVPQVANDILKKLGGKVETVEIGKKRAIFKDPDTKKWNVEQQERGTWKFFDTEAEARAGAQFGAMPQQGFTITPEIREKVLNEGMPLFSRKQSSPNEAPEETSIEAAKRVIQDKMVRFKVIEDWLASQGKALSEAAQVWMVEGNMHGKIAARSEDFRTKIVEPLVEKTQKTGFTMGQVAEYLEMQHIPEANARMRKIHNDKDATANGVTDEAAKAVLAQYQAMPNFAKLEEVAKEWQAITGSTRDILLKGGIITPEMAQAWQATYQNYVPLKGDEEQKGSGTGRGLNVNGKTKRRLGHGDREEAVIQNILRDHERAIQLDEKNKVGIALVHMAVEASNADLVTVGKPVKRQVYQDKVAFEVQYQGIPVGSFDTMRDAQDFILRDSAISKRQGSSYGIAKSTDPSVTMMATPMLADNEVNVYINGHAVRVQLNDELLARAYTNMGVEHVGLLLSGARDFNSWLSKAYTGYNPEFALVNLSRDMFAGSINLTGDYGIGMTAKIYANYPRAIKELLTSFADPAKSKLVSDYRAAGGNTGAAWLSDLERIGKDVMGSYNEYAGTIDTLGRTYSESRGNGSGKVWSGTKATGAAIAAGYREIPFIGHFLKLMEHMNAVTENALRVATFATLRENGYSEAKSAQAAKMSTVNFNRKGEFSAAAGSLYLFFNPSVQGIQRAASVLTSSKHKNQARALAGLMTLGAFAIAEMMRGGDDDDKKKWKQTPDYIKDRNIVINLGNDNQATIPLPYEYSLFWSLGNMLSDAVHGANGWKLGVRLSDAIMANFSPVGNPMQGGEATPVDVMPTAVKMIMSPAWGEQGLDSFGRPLVPKKFSDAKPDSQTMHRTTKGTPLAAISEEVNSLTGGDAYHKGKIDISPETLHYWITSLTGGAGKFAVDTFTLGNNVRQGVDSTELKEMPVVRKFVRESGVSDARQQFYTHVKEAKDKADALMFAKQARDPSGAHKIVADDLPEIKLAAYADAYHKQLKSYSDLVDAIRLDDSLTLNEKRLQMKMYEKKEQAVYDAFDKHFTKLMGDKQKH